MKIYTRTGDDGQSSLFRGGRVWKDDALLKAYGTVDELNSVLGLALTADSEGILRDALTALQHTLFDLGADLATPFPDVDTAQIRRFSEEDHAALEAWIDSMDQEIEPLKTFILPGGSPLASWLHYARTVARRAEREATFALREKRVNPHAYRYINRLADALFVAARFANAKLGLGDVTWDKDR